MKRLISLVLIVSCIFTFSNCSENEVDQIKPYFHFTEDTNTSPEFDANGGTSSVSFETSHNWTASSNQSWITLSRKSGTPSNANFTITVSENKSTSFREGEIEIISNNEIIHNICKSGGERGREGSHFYTIPLLFNSISRGRQCVFDIEV